jgi:hypothetical protein
MVDAMAAKEARREESRRLSLSRAPLLPLAGCWTRGSLAVAAVGGDERLYWRVCVSAEAWEL